MLNQDKELIHALAKSKVYRDFAEDFRQTTALPVALTPVDFWRLAYDAEPRENRFCQALARDGPACVACLQAQYKVAKLAAYSARTMECIYGLCETAVPVRAGEHLLGFIRTGQVFRHAPTPERFARVLDLLARHGVHLNPAKVRQLYFATPVMSPSRYRSAVGLLKLLAQHLAIVGHEVYIQQVHEKNPMIEKAKVFIDTHSGEKLTLSQVAEASNVSSCYFCKQFKRATGVNFSRYLSNFRIAKARDLLLNPHYRITEIAFVLGFGSLTNFNRVFKRIIGLSPTAFRACLGTRKKTRPQEAKERPDSSTISRTPDFKAASPPISLPQLHEGRSLPFLPAGMTDGQPPAQRLQ